MPCLNYVSIGFTLAASGVGFRAAYVWNLASGVEIDPGWRTGPLLSNTDALKPIEPVDGEAQLMGWNSAHIEAWRNSADLNKKAARLTAWAVLLGTISTLIGLLASSI
jgi:hypothetical protein